MESGKCLDRCLVQPLWKAFKGFWNHLVTPMGRGIKTAVLSIPKVVRFTGKTITKGFFLPLQNIFSWLNKTIVNTAVSSAKFANKYAILPVVNSCKSIWNRVIITTKNLILRVFKVLGRGIKTICRIFVNLLKVSEQRANDLNSIPFSPYFFFHLLKEIKNGVNAVFFGIWNTIKGIARAIRRTSRSAITFLKKQVARGLRELLRQCKNKIFWPFKRLLTRVQNFLSFIKRRLLIPVQKLFESHVALPIKNFFSSLFTAVKNFISFVFKYVKNTLVSLFTAIKKFTTYVFNSVKNTLVSIFGKSLRFLRKEIVRPVALLLARTTSFIWKNTFGAAFKLLFLSLKFLFRVTVLRTFNFIRDKIEEIKRRVKGEVSSEGFSLGIEPGLFVQSEDVRGAAMVQLENKQFYSVRLRNNTSHWAEGIVNIDGKKIGIFTLPPGTVVIEGPPNKRMRFMFVQDDSVEANLEGAAKGDSGAGLVQVTFVPQLLATYHKRPDAMTLKKAKEAVLGSELMEYNTTPGAEAKTALSSPSTPVSASSSSSSSSKARTDVNMSSGRTTFGGRTDQQVSTSRTKVPLDWTSPTKLSLCLVATKE
jgi:hypothetical protein